MSNTATKTPLQSTNFWTGVATVGTAAFSFFAITPDYDSAAALATEAQKAIDAVHTKNIVAGFAVLINLGNILWHLFKK